MKKILVVVLLCCVSFGCAGKSPKAICDGAKNVYTKANQAAVAAYAAGLVSDKVWNDCVVPLDTTANAAVIACYRAVLAGDVAGQIQAVADAAIVAATALKQLDCK